MAECNSITSCKIFWSTQSGRAKACARRTARILQEYTTVLVQDVGSAFDDSSEPFTELVANLPSNCFLLLFVSTTGDGEHCDSIRNTWKALLQKSLPPTLFASKRFAMFCLGDRAYGPQFCAAGRKLAVRLLQLGMTRQCDVGYGDDNTPNGGVFRDLDGWLEQNLLPGLEKSSNERSALPDVAAPYRIRVGEPCAFEAEYTEEWQQPSFEDSYRQFFALVGCPMDSYSYNSNGKRIVSKSEIKKAPPLLGRVQSNERITAVDHDQDTRHILIYLESRMASQDHTSKEFVSLPYQAGDIATILPSNSDPEVNRFLKVLPQELGDIADCQLEITVDETSMNNSFCRWPNRTTLRGWLKYCADIHSLPEREDLRALSRYCSPEHELGKDQSDKLLALSETSEAALYADYILREKRSWADVLFDFDSLSAQGSRLTLEVLMMLLPSMRPRHFSIASAPSKTLTLKSESSSDTHFPIELCVAVVAGRTPLGRSYHGLCSEYLSRMMPSPEWEPPLNIWIRPGSFGRVPLELSDGGKFNVPMLCIGAGTGIAPLRSLILERDALRSQGLSPSQDASPYEIDNILVFGCRSKKADYYYESEWKNMCLEHRLRILTAFSRDQFERIYVQKVLREADGGTLIARHVLEQHGAVYVAGGPKMARAVKEEIVATLAAILAGGEKQANQFINQLQRIGRFSIEAWS